ncbi:uncharacterized protein LOC142241213 [Haematobia irritans]|uniref:uncharacterized protein LOC142241213 n=1 Tax=Haematobia irritans TaxID=7368 RepID=UPI003F508341
MFFSGTKKPLAQVFRDGNSRNRFLCELKSSGDTLNKKPTLKQTQICVRRSLKRPNESFTPADKLDTKTELFIMPPIPKITVGNDIKINEKLGIENVPENKASDPMSDEKRNLKVFVGNVEFVIKITKMHPKLNALWDVYGRLIKIGNGKNRFEKIILLRNLDGNGPVLQCSYYDFENTLDKFNYGSHLRLVGKSNGQNGFRTFKVDLIDQSITSSSIMRLQNVNSFVLLQKQN